MSKKEQPRVAELLPNGATNSFRLLDATVAMSTPPDPERDIAKPQESTIRIELVQMDGDLRRFVEIVPPRYTIDLPDGTQLPGVYEARLNGQTIELYEVSGLTEEEIQQWIAEQESGHQPNEKP